MSDYEFDSDLDRKMDSLFQHSDAEFDSDYDRATESFFAYQQAKGEKRKALKTRAERNKRQRTNQTGAGLVPEMEFELVQTLPPKHLTRFHRIVYSEEYRLKHNLDKLDILEMGNAIDHLFRTFMQRFFDQAGEEDQISVTVKQAKIRSIFLSYKKKNFDVEEFANRLESIHQSQSGDSFLLDGELILEVAITKKIVGSGGQGTKNTRSRAPRSVKEFSNSKLSVVQIQNNDNGCGYWAIALAKFHKSKPDRSAWDVVRKNRCKRLELLARELCAQAGVDYDSPMDREAMKKVDAVIKPAYRLTVVDATDKKNRIFIGDAAPTDLYIEYHEEHYNTITNIRGYVGAKFFCVPCYKPYERLGSHRCAGACTQCFAFCDATAESITCSDCNRLFRGPDCLQRHKENKTCSARIRCNACEVEYCSLFPHKCGEVYCNKCKQFSKSTHHCYITPKDQEKLEDEDSRPKFFVAFDIESYLDASSGIQNANLLISLTVCEKCYDPDSKSKTCNECEVCGKGRHVYEGSSCVSDFGNYLYTKLAKTAEKKKAKVIVFAHNFGGFDGHFIMKDVLARDYQPEVIMTGSRVLKLDVGNIRFIDTLSLFQQPLACLPKAFGFSDKAVKGHFPHKFNKPENYGKVFDCIPALTYFGVDECKSEKEKADLVKWHSEQSGPWNFREQIIKYCDADVQVLLIALMSFRNEFRTITGLDPLSRNFTLASIGLEYYRAKYLNDTELGITPTAGYSLRNNSAISSAWLCWKEKQHGKSLSRERHIGPYFADGYDEETKTVYEFNGCFWHGCLTCYADRSENLGTAESPSTADNRYREYIKKKNYYGRHGYTLDEVWECELRHMRAEDSGMDLFIEDKFNELQEKKKVGGAKIRESFFGGRTDNLRFYHHAQENEHIEYKDVTSEYPYVLKFKEYPVGHPTVLTEDFDYTIASYFGFVKCTILPPRGLYLPVLPVRQEGKLLFPLCRTCAATQQQSPCRHSQTDRQITGTWTTMELLKALEKGYTIAKIYEVLHYQQKSSEMFKKYINSWLKIKQEASGWPSYCTTEETKVDYLRRYKEREGIDLDRDNIAHNPGKRSIAKLMLNSFWGKLSQRPNLPQTKICKEYHQYWSLVEDEDIILNGEFSPNDDTIIVSYEHKDTEKADPGNTSIAIASFVTSYARLHLYKFMDMVDEIGHDRLLYHDTDSIIFVRKEGDPEIETGDYLGDLTDELPPGARCIRFVSGGPKNYGYQYTLADGTAKTVIKTKGIRHNCQTLGIFDLDKMEEIVSDFAAQSEPRTSKILKLPQTTFRSSWKTHDVKTTSCEKIYRVVSNKKWILGNETRPFGF